MADFQDKLIMLIIEETGGKPLTGMTPGKKMSEIVEVMASQLGKFVAINCGGDAKIMSEFLEDASSYMFEVAADNQKIGQFFGDPNNLTAMRRGPDGKLRPSPDDGVLA